MRGLWSIRLNRQTTSTTMYRSVRRSSRKGRLLSIHSSNLSADTTRTHARLRINCPLPFLQQSSLFDPTQHPECCVSTILCTLLSPSPNSTKSRRQVQSTHRRPPSSPKRGILCTRNVGMCVIGCGAATGAQGRCSQLYSARRAFCRSWLCLGSTPNLG